MGDQRPVEALAYLDAYNVVGDLLYNDLSMQILVP